MAQADDMGNGKRQAVIIIREKREDESGIPCLLAASLTLNNKKMNKMCISGRESGKKGGCKVKLTSSHLMNL